MILIFRIVLNFFFKLKNYKIVVLFVRRLLELGFKLDVVI